MNTCDTCQWLESTAKRALAKYDEAYRCWRLVQQGERDEYNLRTALGKDSWRHDYDLANNLLERHQRRHHPPYSNTGVT